MKQTTVHIPNDQYDWIQRAKEEWGCSQSDIARRAIDLFRDRHPLKDAGEAVESPNDPVDDVEDAPERDSAEEASRPDGEDSEEQRSWLERKLW